MTASSRIKSSLRFAAVLLLTLPASVAAACFAHGHGALGSTGLLAVLAAAIGAGAWSAYTLLMALRASQNASSTFQRPAYAVVRVRNR